MPTKYISTGTLFHSHQKGWTKYVTPFRLAKLYFTLWLVWLFFGLPLTNTQFVSLLVGLASLYIASRITWYRRAGLWRQVDAPWMISEIREFFELNVFSMYTNGAPDRSKLTIMMCFNQVRHIHFELTDRPVDVRCGDQVWLEYRLFKGSPEIRRMSMPYMG